MCVGYKGGSGGEGAEAFKDQTLITPAGTSVWTGVRSAVEICSKRPLETSSVKGQPLCGLLQDGDE